MYAAFGHVAEAANRLLTQQWIRYGFLSDQQTVLGALYDLATKHPARLLALIVGIYVLRRLLDYLAERTGLRVLGLVVVLIEAFFMLMVIMGGIRVFQEFQLWLRDRAVMQWLAAAEDAVADFFAIFKIKLPEILTRVWAFFSDHIWPVLIDVVAQPLFWLAVAALVFGSRVLSLAELWRRGQPYASRVPGATAFAAIARSEPSGASGHRRKACAWLRPASRRPSSATSMTNTYLRCMHFGSSYAPGRSSWARTSSCTTW
jgi:hypothetical protein